MSALRRLLLLRFVPETTAEQIAAVEAAFTAVAALSPGLLSYTVRRLVHCHSSVPAVSGWAHIVDAVYADRAALAAFTFHPAHLAAIRDHLAPIRADALCVDYELPATFDLKAFIACQHPPYARVVYLFPERAEAEAAGLRVWAQSESAAVAGVVGSFGGRQQDAAKMFPGYVDRSKAWGNAVEIPFVDSHSMQAHLDTAPHIDRALTVAYLC